MPCHETPWHATQRYATPRYEASTSLHAGIPNHNNPSQFTTGYAQMLLRRQWEYAGTRELWRGRKPEGPKMNTMPLIEGGMTDLVRGLHVVQTFIAQTREVVGQAIKGDVFPNELVEVRALSLGEV